MNKSTDQTEPSSTLPETEDGFHQPTQSVKRRNLITAAIIVVFILLWVLLGLRNALF